MSEKRSRTAIVSGGLEPVIDVGRGGHSVFANAIISTLEGNSEIIRARELFLRIERPVVLNSKQTPQYSDIKWAGHEGGEFIFVPQGSTVVVVPPVQSGKTDVRAMELALWNSIKDSSEPAAFESYLDQFPTGTFAVVARLKLEKLKANTEQAPAKTQTAMVAPPAPTVEIDEMDETFVAVKNANFRSSPTTKSEKVATVNKGTEVAVTGKSKDNNWYRIEHEGGEAYVYASLLQEKGAWEEAEKRRAKLAKREAEDQAQKQGEAKRATEERVRKQAEAERRAENAAAQRRAEEEASRRRAEEEAAKRSQRQQQAAVVAPPKPVGYDGAWRLAISAQSFEQGEHGRIKQMITVADGRFQSQLQDDQTRFNIQLKIIDGRLNGRLDVTLPNPWLPVSFDLSGSLRDGNFNGRYSKTTSDGRRHANDEFLSLNIEVALTRD